MSHTRPKAPQSVALFGGSFDPIHSGHLSVARSALKRFALDRIYFIPSGMPPTSSAENWRHFRIAWRWWRWLVRTRMNLFRHWRKLATITAVTKFLIPWILFAIFGINCTITSTCISYMGADQFLEIATWKDYETLLGSCDFIVANRPGFDIGMLRLVIPPDLLGRHKASAAPEDPEAIALRKTTVHPLTTVSSHVSATEIRRRIRHGEPISGLVPPRVEDYIHETGPIPVKAETLKPELRCAIEAAHNKKAGSVTLLDLDGLGAFTGYFLICTGFSERQVSAIASEIEDQLHLLGVRIRHREGGQRIGMGAAGLRKFSGARFHGTRANFLRFGKIVAFGKAHGIC